MQHIHRLNTRLHPTREGSLINPGTAPKASTQRGPQPRRCPLRGQRIVRRRRGTDRPSQASPATSVRAHARSGTVAGCGPASIIPPQPAHTHVNASAPTASSTSAFARPLSRPARSQYEDFMRHVHAAGVAKADRTGTGTLSVFGHQMRFDLAEGFPLVTTKKVHFKSVALELLWFLRGDSNVRWLRERGVTIWDEWAGADGELGPVYGVQWRSWPTPEGGQVDQIAQVVQQLRSDPDSRRIVVSAWNVAALPQMALAPCHAFFQFWVAPAAAPGARRRLSCQLYQRSADLFLGVPFNLASYALLTHMLAQQCDFEPGDFIWCGGDCHIYDNHTEQVQLQLSRPAYPFPRLQLKRRPPSIFDYELADFELLDYQHHPAIKAPVAV